MQTQKKRYHTSRALQIIVAATLMLVFLLQPCVEAYHHLLHPGVNPQLSFQLKKGDLPEYKANKFCKLCDYLRHANPSYTMSKPDVYTVFLDFLILRKKAIKLGLVPALILSYANKGPPAL